MGPRLVGRGKRLTVEAHSGEFAPSMGPRLVGRGKVNHVQFVK